MSVTLTQDQSFLPDSELSRTVTIAAGQSSGAARHGRFGAETLTVDESAGAVEAEVIAEVASGLPKPDTTFLLEFSARGDIHGDLLG